VRHAIVMALLAFLAALTVSLADIPTAQAASHPTLTRQQVRTAQHGVHSAAARWAPQVNRYWSRWLWRYLHRRLTVAELHRALLIIWRESGGQPGEVNPTSGCAGLFQLVPGHWRGRFDPFNPITNISLAGMLYVRRGWAPWATTAY